MNSPITTTEKLLVFLFISVFAYTSAYTQSNVICNPLQVQKCALPFGKWEMTSAELVELVHSQDNIVGGITTRVDSIFGVTNTTGAPSTTIVQRTLRFSDGQHTYAYVFKNNGATLESVTFDIKVPNLKTALEEFDKSTKAISSSNSANKKSSTYSYNLVCGTSGVTVSIGKSKSNPSRVVLMYSFVAR